MIAAPPSSAGGVNVTFAWPSPAAVAPTPVGAPGTPAGVTAFDGAEDGPSPVRFVAFTVKV